MAEGKGIPTTEQENRSDKRPPWWKRLGARTGFGDKTLWDLLQLLIVPLVLVGIGFLFEMQQAERQEALEQQQQALEDRRAKAERELAEQRAQDEALQAYLDQMGALLLAKDSLRESEEGSEVRTLARARTLTVLGRLDPSRKRAVMQFLLEAELVQRVEGGSGSIITLAGADLSEANLSEATLSNADLVGADLSYATLSEANLSYADLSNATLSYAYGVTEEQLEEQAQTLAGATMPDGTIYPGRYAAREFEPAVSFEVGDGWRLSLLETTDVLFIEGPERGQLIFTRPHHVYDPSNPSESKEVPAPENADEWASWFQRHPNLDTSKPVPVSVGGASGKRIDVTYASTPENYPRDICGEEPCVPLYTTSEFGNRSYDGWKDRFIIVDVGGETVIIDAAAPTDKFDEFFPKAQTVLDTVEWKGG